jgi:hypothetical protein
MSGLSEMHGDLIDKNKAISLPRQAFKKHLTMVPHYNFQDGKCDLSKLSLGIAFFVCFPSC